MDQTKNIYPSFEIIPMCTCGRENYRMIMNKFYFEKFEQFLDENNVNENLKNIATHNIVPEINSLPFCCKLRCRFGAVYSIPVEISSRISSKVERREILSLPGPLGSLGLFSWAHKTGFVYTNGVISIEQ